MVRRGRPGFSEHETHELWRLWRAGRSQSDISRALGKRPGSIYFALSAKGGIAPVQRRRAAGGLSLREREEISRGLASGLSLHAIAAPLGRAASTISREVARNGGRDAYRAVTAEQRAWQEGLRPKPCLLARNAALSEAVAQKLAARWSPQQISGWLSAEHPDDEAMRVSHETIYKSLFIQARGVLKKELVSSLRSRRTMRRARTSTRQSDLRGQIIGAVSIRERPAEVEDRAVPGHWEGDLLSGGRNTHIATLVERRSRFVMLVRLANRESETVVDALLRQIQRLPEGVMRSLTWDRGKEMAHHARFSMASDVAVYFCDPHSPWQRGSNENTNGLLRQYMPKGSDLSKHSQDDLDAIALELNTRPRQTLGFKTPATTFAQAVAPTA
jgi:IS30 family transposase